VGTSAVSKADAGPGGFPRPVPDLWIPVENRPVPLAVLISGRGTNLRAIADAAERGDIPARVAVVLSNRADAAGLEFARARGIPSEVLPHDGFDSRDAYDQALVDRLRGYGVRLVCLAGFMRVLGAPFIDAFPNAVLNIHPSLLPSFPGMHAQRQALEYGVTITGATVHLASAELDAGPIVMQAAVPVESGDTEGTLAARILIEENRLYPRAIAAVLAGGWRIEGRRLVTADPKKAVR
jgi:phosphoribosylglycinamide formyltransferase 1